MVNSADFLLKHFHVNSLPIFLPQLAPEKRLTFALILLMLDRHRGRNLHNARISQVLVLEDNSPGKCNVSLGVEEVVSGRASPCCSPPPNSLLQSLNSNAGILQCLSPPLSSHAYRLPSPTNDAVTSGSFLSAPTRPENSTSHVHTQSTASPPRNVLSEYCCAKTVSVPSPDSQSSHSAEVSGPVFTFFNCGSQHKGAHAGSHSGVSSAFLSPPVSGDCQSRACSTPVHDGRISPGSRLFLHCRGKSPRSQAARPARHQRSASLSKHLIRVTPSFTDQSSASAPSSPTSPKRSSSLVRLHHKPLERISRSHTPT